MERDAVHPGAGHRVDTAPPPWRLVSPLVEIRSPWLTVVAERFEESPGRELDYWRVERPDSVVVVTLLRGRLLLPPPSYRPGVGRVTLDLAGARVQEGCPVADAAVGAVRREFAISEEASIGAVTRLNEVGWEVDSSASSQRLYGAVVELGEDTLLAPERLGGSYPATAAGVKAVLSDLTCLQCREVLREWSQSAE